MIDETCKYPLEKCTCRTKKKDITVYREGNGK